MNSGAAPQPGGVAFQPMTSTQPLPRPLEQPTSQAVNTEGAGVTEAASEIIEGDAGEKKGPKGKVDEVTDKVGEKVDEVTGKLAEKADSKDSEDSDEKKQSKGESKSKADDEAKATKSTKGSAGSSSSKSKRKD